MAERIKVLFLATNPVESSRLRLGEEIRIIGKEIRTGPNGHLFDVSSAWAVRPEDLYEMLLIYRPNIIHLSGHATKSKGIILEDDAGSMKPISVQGLVGLFKAFSDNIRVVFLNMCHTQGYLDGLSEVIDYTVGIKNKINDSGAIVFSASFYKGLSFGLPVKVAFDLAVNQMILQRLPYSNSPILKIREKTNDSAPFLCEPDTASWDSVTAESAEEVHGRVVPLLGQTRDVGYESNGSVKKVSRGKGKKKHKDAKPSMKAEIAELRRDVSELKAELERVIVKKKYS